MPSGGETRAPVAGESLSGATRGWPRGLARNAALVLIITAIIIVSARRSICASTASPVIAGPSVAVASVARQDLPVVVQALGTVTPLSTVTVKSQISGYLTDVHFREGQIAKRGDLLAQ